MVSENTPPKGAVETAAQAAERELEKARAAAEQAKRSAEETHAEHEKALAEAKAAADKVADLRSRIDAATLSAAQLREQADALEKAEREAKALLEEADRRRQAAEEKAKRLEEALAAVKVAEEADAKAQQARKEADEATKRAQDAEAAARRAKADADAKLAAANPVKSTPVTDVKPVAETPAAPPPTPPAPPETASEGKEGPRQPSAFEVLNGKVDQIIDGQQLNRWITVAGMTLILLFLAGGFALLHGDHLKMPKQFASILKDKDGNWAFAGVCKDVKASVSDSALQNAINKAACVLNGETPPEAASIRACKRSDYRCYYSEKQECRDGLDFLDPSTCKKKSDRVCEGGFTPSDVLTDAFKSEARACPGKKKRKSGDKKPDKPTKEETKKEEKKEEAVKTATSETHPEVVEHLLPAPTPTPKESPAKAEPKPAPPPPPPPAEKPAAQAEPKHEKVGKVCVTKCEDVPVEAAAAPAPAPETSSSSLRRIALADVKTVPDGQIKLIKRSGPDGCQLALRVAGDVGHELYRKGSASAVISGNGVFVTVVDTDHPYLLTLRSSKGYLFRMAEDEAKMDQVSSPDGTVISNFYFIVDTSCKTTKASDF